MGSVPLPEEAAIVLVRSSVHSLKRWSWMHEYSLVTELVEECQRRAGQRRVRSVTVRCPATVDRLELKTLFVAVSTEHHMAGVRFETVNTPWRCTCGYEGELPPEAHVGHLAVCPRCSVVQPLEDVLELVAVDTET